MLPEYNVLPGFALDLTTTDENGRHWDFTKSEQRAKARRRFLALKAAGEGPPKRRP